MFFALFFSLISLPFLVIYLDINAYVSLKQILGVNALYRTTLAPGDGQKPLLILCIFQTFFFLGCYLGDRQKFEGIQILNISDSRENFSVILILSILTLTYLLTRNLLYQDFPLIALFNEFANSSLRVLAYAYGSRTDLPYIFLPSIHSQFYRYLLPFLTFLICLIVIKKKIYTPLSLVFVLLFVLLTAAMIIGTFKRTPLLIIGLWIFVFFSGYNKQRLLLPVIATALLIVLAILAMTSFYSVQWEITEAINKLAPRFITGEAKGEFLALEHYGSTFNYEGVRLATDYLQKILGSDVQTFSERWKITTGGTRGRTSVGIMAELYISLSWFSVIFYVILGLVIVRLDKIFEYNFAGYNRVLLSGLIVSTSFISIKGLLSQFFVGGILTFLCLIMIFNLAPYALNFINASIPSRTR